jgi:hypothetical protein
MFGDRLNVVVEECDSDVKELEELLRKNSITINDVRPIPPSLENVFMHLIKDAN